MNKYLARLGVLLLIAILAGCSQSMVRQGDRALRHGNCELAKERFLNALQSKPDDLEIRRGLGRSYFCLGEYGQADSILSSLWQEHRGDALTTLYLGMTKEAEGDLESAGRVYGSFQASSDKSQLAQQIRGRYLYVHNEYLRQQVKHALEFESEQKLPSDTIRSVGVLPFGITDSTADSLKPLGDGLAAAVSYDLAQVKGIKLVERLKLKYLLDELSLVEKGYTSEESSPRLGRIVGANDLVGGSLTPEAGNKLGIQSYIVNTGDSKYSVALDHQDQFDKLMQLQKQLSFAIIDSLGIKLTPEERNAIEKIPTTSYQAFWAYSRGIGALDAGNYDMARDDFNAALNFDPGFAQAAASKNEASLLNNSSGTLKQFESSSLAGGGYHEANAVTGIQDIYGTVDQSETPPGTIDPVLETGTATVSGSIR
jgi:tetratricopeptide (TPR) repeat protein